MRLLSAHAKLANQLGIDDNRIFIPALGDVIEFSKGKASMTGQVPAGNVLVDGDRKSVV